MKKNNWHFTALLLSFTLLLASCGSDKSVSDTFKGKYTVKVESINLKELQKASEQVKIDLEKGKKELNEGLEKAQKEIDKDVEITIDGKKADLKDVMGKVGEGLDKMMDGFGEMGNGLGDFGKMITENVIKNATFQADFHVNGDLSVGSDNSSLNFTAKKLTWKIEDGKLVVKDKDKQSENFSFDLKQKNGKEWELSNEHISLLLSAGK